MDIFNSNTEDFLKKAIEKNPKAAEVVLGGKLPKWIKEGVNFRKISGGPRFKIMKIDADLKVLFITAFRVNKVNGATTENKFTYSFNAMIKLCDNNLIQQM